MSLIRKVAVLGSGVMGIGIAAHVANAGIPVLMLDMVPPKPGPGDVPASKAFRNKFALGGLANLRKLRPAPLYTPAALDLIEVGNFDDDLQRIAELDRVRSKAQQEVMTRAVEKITPDPPAE
jgi:3-hydroxyacyl-CoA dehydrogenase